MPADPTLTIGMPTPGEALRSPDVAAAAVALLDPSGDGLDAVLVLGARRMSDTGLVDALVACERLLAAVAGKQQEFLAEIARRDPDGELYLRDEVACALELAPATAGQRLDVAVELSGRLADTGELLSAGYLSYANARALAHAVQELPDEVVLKVQYRVLPRGCDQTPGEFKAAVRRAVAKFDRKDEAARHAQAFTDRNVISYPDGDHMADVVLHLAADGAAAVLTAVNTWATKTGTDDTRTADQRRADAIVDICSAALAMPGLPRQHGIRPAITVTVAGSTLAGRDDQPAELDGYGPIPASMARRLANLPGATQHRYAVDQHGRIVDRPEVITDSYQPSVRLTRHVIMRDQHCIHPGCRRRARTCELDHRQPWPAGPTSAENLQPLCRRHHDLKHHSTWTVRRCHDGSYHWTSPTRRIQAVDATLGGPADSSSSSTRAGVFQPWRLRGRLLSSAATKRR